MAFTDRDRHDGIELLLSDATLDDSTPYTYSFTHPATALIRMALGARQSYNFLISRS